MKRVKLEYGTNTVRYIHVYKNDCAQMSFLSHPDLSPSALKNSQESQARDPGKGLENVPTLRLNWGTFAPLTLSVFDRRRTNPKVTARTVSFSSHPSLNLSARPYPDRVQQFSLWILQLRRAALSMPQNYTLMNIPIMVVNSMSCLTMCASTSGCYSPGG